MWAAGWQSVVKERSTPITTKYGKHAMIRSRSLLAASMLLLLALGGCASNTNTEKIKPQDRGKVADLNTKIAIAYIRDGDFEPALEKLEKAISADPNHAPAYSTLGLLYNRVGEFDEAEKNFEKAVRLDPKSSAILNNYGQVLCQHEQYEKGQKMFLRANENSLYRTPEIALSNAGTCAMAAGDLGAAETHFRDALKINPRVPPPLLQMAVVSYSLERYLPARGYLQRYLEVANHGPESLWTGIQIERELGDKDAVSSYSLLLQKEYPDSKQTQLFLESEAR
ncbi:MAG: type IV pilus assembly protein PilF [Gammaproteobacteria bacterium]|jgi:type IV pilus assembly protein PilF